MLSGENFVQQGLISQDQLELAAQKQSELGGNEPIARLLVSLGFISERDRVKAMGEVWNIPFVELADTEPDPAATGLLSAQLAKRFRALPLRLEDGKLVVAMVNPLDVFVIDEIRMTTGKEVEPAIAVEEDLTAAYAAFYKQDMDLGDTLQGVMSDFDGDLEVRSDDEDEDLSEDQLREMGEDAPIIRLANLIINQAVSDKASDIHIEPRKDGLVVRYRIDGMMLEAMTLPRKVIAPLTSRFKIVANMDIAEKRAPQDNRISAVINGRDYDFRVSTLPVVYGEKIVMRVLDKGSINVGLEKLGFLEHNLETIREFTQKSYGIILVTGPTGSGKSTTLYSILNAMNDGERNIITIEDPVEYELSGINQCNVNVKANMTFAAGLRSMLRQDPDVIMVGEMRDKETATIAMEAALTGHVVLSTLHTNDAASAPTRLIDMDVEPFLISSSIIGVLAQRLGRTICPNCREAYEGSRDDLVRYGFPIPEALGADTGGKIQLFRGEGCEKCKGSGYKGRTGLHELMVMTDDLRDEVLKRSPSHQLRNMALREGMMTLQMDAVAKVLKGVTTVEEVLRVVYA